MSPVWRAENGCYSIYNAETGMYHWERLRRWEDHPYGTGSYEYCTWSGCTTCDEYGSTATQMSFVDLWKREPLSWFQQWSWLDNPEGKIQNAGMNAQLLNLSDAFA